MSLKEKHLANSDFCKDTIHNKALTKVKIELGESSKGPCWDYQISCSRPRLVEDEVIHWTVYVNS